MSEVKSDVSPRRFQIRLLVILALLAGIQAAFIFATGIGKSSEVYGRDGWFYHTTALNLLDHGTYSCDANPPGQSVQSLPPGYTWDLESSIKCRTNPRYGPTLFRTPGYSLWLATLYTAFGRSFVAVRLIQIGLHVLTCWLLFAVGVPWVGRRSAAAGSILCAFYQPLVAFTTEHHSENLAVFLTVAMLYAATRSCATSGRSGTGWALACGGLAGYLTLTRPALAPLLLIPIGMLITTFPTKPALWAVRTLLAITGAAILIAPWIWHTREVSGAPRLALSGNFSLWQGALEYTGSIGYRETYEDWKPVGDDWAARYASAAAKVDPASPVPATIQEEVVTDAEWREEAFRVFRDAGLNHLPQHMLAGTRYLWGTSVTDLWLVGWKHKLSQLQYLVYAALLLFGMVLSRRRWLALWPVWSMALYLTVVHLAIFVSARYTLPARPFLLLLAGVGACRLADIAASAIQRKRRPTC